MDHTQATMAERYITSESLSEAQSAAGSMLLFQHFSSKALHCRHKTHITLVTRLQVLCYEYREGEKSDT